MLSDDDDDEQLINRCIVQYHFIDDEHEVWFVHMGTLRVLSHMSERCLALLHD